MVVTHHLLSDVYYQLSSMVPIALIDVDRVLVVVPTFGLRLSFADCVRAVLPHLQLHSDIHRRLSKIKVRIDITIILFTAIFVEQFCVCSSRQI